MEKCGDSLEVRTSAKLGEHFSAREMQGKRTSSFGQEWTWSNNLGKVLNLSETRFQYL